RLAAGQPVDDEVGPGEHPGAPEPGPFPTRPVPVCGVSRGPLVQPGGHLQQDLVGGPALVIPGLTPPDATAAGAVPAAGHVGENVLGLAEVVPVPGEVIGADPGERPP